MLLFLLLVWCLSPGLPVLCWIRTVRVGILVLFLILDEMLSSLSMMLAWACYVRPFLCLGMFYTQFIECFYHKNMLYFTKRFFCLYWNDRMIFIFHAINMVYHIYWFVYIEPYLHLRNKSPWSCGIILFICWIRFASIFWEFFHLCSSGI